jgi:hypothetical protein
MGTDDEILARIDAAFGDVPKPEHFTCYTHCEECAEHDETLRSNDRASLQVSHVGNPGWDPLCFASPAGKAYYMPALARLALAPPTREYGWYGDQLVFHLSSGGAQNAFLAYCSPAQRQAVAGLLAHFVETRAAEAEDCFGADDLLRAHDLWSAAG